MGLGRKGRIFRPRVVFLDERGNPIQPPQMRELIPKRIGNNERRQESDRRSYWEGFREIFFSPLIELFLVLFIVVLHHYFRVLVNRRRYSRMLAK